MKNGYKNGVFSAIRMASSSYRLLTAGTFLCVAASVAASLVPPLLLARIIDRLTGGIPLSSLAVLVYFGGLALEGILSSAQESLLVLFGQKMTHALRSEMSQKLTRLPAGTLSDNNPGEVAARFSGDVDTVEALLRHYQHGGGRLPYYFDHGRYRGKKYRPGADTAAGAAVVCGIYPLCAEAHAGRAAG